MPRSRAHHYIPRFHLRGFAAGLGPEVRRRCLFRFDKRSGTISRLSIARAAVVKDLFTLPAETGHHPDALENLFGVQEGVIAPLIRRFRSLTNPGRWALSPDFRDGLAGYLAMLHIRSPTYRDVARRWIGWFGSIDLDMTLSSPDRFGRVVRASGWQGTDEELEAYRLRELDALRSGHLFVEAPPISSMADLRLAIDALRPALLDRRWVILRRERWPHLVIGDQPVTLLGASGQVGDIGFAVQENEILVPIGSDCLLALTGGGHSDDIEVVTPDRSALDGLEPPWWHQANVAAWRTSGRFIYARSEADLQAVRLALDPDLRQAELPGPGYRGGDPAWAAYADRLGIRELREDELPTSL